MSSRRAFLQTSSGVVASTTAMNSGGDATAEDKTAITAPKVVSGNEGTKVWAMGVLVTVKVRAEDTAGLFGL